MKLMIKIFAFAAAMLMAGCGLNKPPEATVRYDLSGTPSMLDPQYASHNSEIEVIANCFEGLTAASDSGEAIPACAESWEVSDNGKKYTFKLRDDIKWSNGDAVTAEDFEYGIKRLFGPAAISPSAGDFTMIENAEKILSGELPVSKLGVEAKCNDELIITLDHPAPSLLTVLSHTAAAPCQKEFFEDQKGRYGLEAKNLICNGPFAVDSWSGEYIILKRNTHYRKEIKISGVNMYINREDGLKRFKEGSTDLFLIPFYRMNEAQDFKGKTVYNQSWAMVFNYNNTALSSKDVRASLAAAIKQDGNITLPDYLKQYEGIIAPNAMVFGVRYRDEAGMPQKAQLPQEIRKSFLSALNSMQLNDVGKTTLLVGGFEPGPQLGGNFQRVWQHKLSSFINMEQLEYNTLVRRVTGGDFDIAIAPMGASSSGSMDSLALFERLGGEHGEVISKLIGEAKLQDETEAAVRLLAEAEQYLVDEYIAVPLFSAPSLFVMAEGISGVRYDSISRVMLFADAVCIRK